MFTPPTIYSIIFRLFEEYKKQNIVSYLKLLEELPNFLDRHKRVPDAETYKPRIRRF